MGGARADVGIIGGSGLYQMPALTDVEEVSFLTPFGAPSDTFTLGTLGNRRVAFLPRHGRGHRLNPSEIPFQANIYAFKQLGVRRLVSVSAVGSMQEAIAPLDFVVPDQLVDRTVSRPRSFFDQGIVAHVGLADPYCPALRPRLAAAGRAAGARVHEGGTLICIEGPQFSTRAESRIFRQWGVDVIGMTALPEARLAREAELCYATLACVTDYDVWHETEAAVTVGLVVQHLHQNVARAQATIKLLMPLLDDLDAAETCACGAALASAIITAPERIPAVVRQRLGILVDRYLPGPDNGQTAD